jgi:hypothetical protein
MTPDAARGLVSERARHLVLGLSQEWATRWTARVDVYRRSLDDLVVGRLETAEETEERIARYDFPEDLAGEIPMTPIVTSQPANGARGVAQGLEVIVSRRPAGSGSGLSGQVSYTLASAEREAYGGRAPFDYERRHALSAVLEWRPLEGLSLGATWRAASGFPRTPAVGVRVAAAPGPGSSLVPARDDSGQLVYGADFGDISNLNSARLPDFARLDLRATLRPRGRDGRFLVYLDLINVLGRENAGRINTVLVRGPDPERPVVTEEPVLSLPFVPSLGLRFRF